MRFNFALISVLFFASAVLADHSLEHRSSQLNIVEKRTNATSDSGEVIYDNFAGAALNESVPTFFTVSSTFEVPQILGPAGSGVGIWVGIDLGSQCGAIFQAGVMYRMTAYGPLYNAIAEWMPDGPIEFTDIKVSPGDFIKVTVASDQTTGGNATIANLIQNQVQTLEFSNQVPALCHLNAVWAVSKVGNSPLANFSTVSFRHPLANSTDQEFTPDGSVIFEIENKTAVYADGHSVTIWYYELVT